MGGAWAKGRGMRQPRPASPRASESPKCPLAANPRPATFDYRPACRPPPLRDHPNPAHASAAPRRPTHFFSPFFRAELSRLPRLSFAPSMT